MKSRREKNAARRRSFGRHGSRFELLEPRQLLTATGLTTDSTVIAWPSLVSSTLATGAPLELNNTLVTPAPPVEATLPIEGAPVSTGIVGEWPPIVTTPIWYPTPIWNGPIYYPLPTHESTGPLPAPTVSLPNLQAPINGGTNTGISGIWVTDPGSDDMTVTISVQHGTLSVGGYYPGSFLYGSGPFPQDDAPYGNAGWSPYGNGVSVTGNGTSTITLTGTAQGIDELLGTLGTSYPYYQPPLFDYDQPIALDDAQPGVTSPGIVSLPQVTAIPENAGGDWGLPIESYPIGGVTSLYLGNSLTYTADAGFTGTDALTVSAYGSNASGSSATTTSTLLLDVLPQVQPPTINTPYSVNAGPSGVVVFNGTGANELSINDPSAGTGTIQVTLSDTAGTLTLGSTTGVSIDGGANGSDSITFSGTVAAVNKALDGLQYVRNTRHRRIRHPHDRRQRPGAQQLRPARNLHREVSITQSYFSGPSSTQYIAPGSSVVFNNANGNAIAVLPNGSDQEQLQIYDQSGKLTLASTTGLTFISGGNGQDSMTIAGSATDINNALNGLTYTANPLPAGSTTPYYDDICFTLTDPSLGYTWGDGYLDGGSVSVGITPGGIPPASTLPVTVTTPPAQSTGAGAPLTFSVAGGNAVVINDPASVASGADVSLTISANYGTLALTQSSGVTVGIGGSGLTLTGTVSAIDAALDGLIYTPNSGFAGVDTLQFSYQNNPSVPSYFNSICVNQNLGIVVGASSQGVPISAPTTGQSASPTAPLVFSPGNGNAITLSNPGISATNPVQMTLSVGGSGTLNLAGTLGVTIVSGANGSSSLTIDGTIAALNAALDGLTFTPGSGDVGRTELDLTVSVPGDSALGTTAARVPLLDELAAPPAVITVPSGQLFNTTTPVVFSTGNQNAISLNDPGMGNQQVQLTLSVQDGTLSLGSTAGLTFNSGG